MYRYTKKVIKISIHRHIAKIKHILYNVYQKHIFCGIKFVRHFLSKIVDLFILFIYNINIGKCFAEHLQCLTAN